MNSTWCLWFTAEHCIDVSDCCFCMYLNSHLSLLWPYYSCHPITCIKYQDKTIFHSPPQPNTLSLTSIEHPIRAALLWARSMVLKRSSGAFSLISYRSQIPPVKSVRASLVSPPLRFSYVPFNLPMKTRLTVIFSVGTANHRKDHYVVSGTVCHTNA